MTYEHIYLIHYDQIQRYGGQKGHYIFTFVKIESILAQQYPYLGADKYPGIFQKAAMLMYSFTKEYCFLDGNKRVAIQSAIVFLMLNGCEDHLKDADGYEKLTEIVRSKHSHLEKEQYILKLADWLAERFETP